jgi:putative PEP-CTERM system TPR-repeat lipoprotein
MNSLIQAEIYLARATQAGPELALARRLLIMTYLRSGQPAKALASLNAVASNDGLVPELFSVAGEVYLQNGDAKKAEEYFAKAVELEPRNAGKRTALAISHLLSGQTAVAFDELQEIASSDSGTTADLALISAHWKRREFDQALAAVDRLEKKLPDKPLAANLRGRIQLAQSDRAAARKSFERALTIDPAYFAAAASLAALDIADKKPEEARKRFELLLTRNPKNGMALLALAELAATQGAGKDEVAGLLNKAIQINPTDVAPRLLLINLFLRTNDNKQAESAAQSAVSAVPSSPELLDALGRAQQASGDLNQAIATFRNVIAMQPLSPQRYVRLAEAHMANKDSAAAEQSLRKALEIKPDQLDAQRALILLNVNARNYPGATKIARTVQQQRPKAAVGYLFEGDIANAQKNWGAAAAAYRAALEREAPSPDTSTKLHAVLVASGKVAEADVFASHWQKEHPKDLVFLTYQGELAIAKKEYEVAEKQYQIALQAQPDNPVVLNNLAWVTGQLGKNGAVELAERANKLAPNQPTFLDTLAMLLADRNEFARAIDLQTKAVGLQPSNPGLRLDLAKIYIKAGDRRRAKTELETLVKLGNNFPSQSEVNTLLRTL